MRITRDVKMAAKAPSSIDTRTDLAELVKRRAEIAVSMKFHAY